MYSFHGTGTGKNIFKEVEKTIQLEVECAVLQVMVIKNMYGAEKALVGQTNKACGNKVFKICGYLLYVHQQELDGQYLSLSCDMELQCQ